MIEISTIARVSANHQCNEDHALSIRYFQDQRLRRDTGFGLAELMTGSTGLRLVLLCCIVCTTFDHRAWLGSPTDRCLLSVVLSPLLAGRATNNCSSMLRGIDNRDLATNAYSTTVHKSIGQPTKTGKCRVQDLANQMWCCMIMIECETVACFGTDLKH